jgi:hypothetical protein
MQTVQRVAAPPLNHWRNEMKKVFAAIALAACTTAVWASCSTHTIFSGNRTVICTTCCYGPGNCTTSCF